MQRFCTGALRLLLPALFCPALAHAADTGIGMSPSFLTRIFDGFARRTPTASSNVRKRVPEKMKLGSNEQCCRNRFLAEISSGNRPVLSVFHEIRCHQANIGTFIRKDSDHAGTSPNFTIQSLNHIGR